MTALQASFVPTVVRFRVEGIPEPQGSMVPLISRTTGRAMVKPSNEKNLRRWRKAITTACEGLVEGPISAPVTLRVAFRLPRPPSVAKSRLYPLVKPDLSKLVRALEDGMVDGRVIEDDALIVDIHASKRYAGPGQQPGVLVEVEVLPGRS